MVQTAQGAGEGVEEAHEIVAQLEAAFGNGEGVMDRHRLMGTGEGLAKTPKIPERGSKVAFCKGGSTG